MFYVFLQLEKGANKSGNTTMGKKLSYLTSFKFVRKVRGMEKDR